MMWMVYSKDYNALPVTSTKMAERPCMDSFVQTSRGYFSLETSRFTECPVEPNTDERYDPRYLVSPDFETNEYEVQVDNGVLSILE